MRTIERSDSPILSDRIARWEAEMPPEPKETWGCESNPTGNPIGGGEGYSDIVTGGDQTVTSYDELRSALSSTVDGQTVFVPGDAEIDFGGQEILEVPRGVTIASDRGSGGSPGGLLFSDVLATPGMLRAMGACVRFTGFRLRGPCPHRERAAHTSNGISTTKFGTEIDNCEISGFSVSATGFWTGAVRGYVHHNFIHHNQKGGLGYGVSVGGSVLIEANLFDYCRHHIGATGAPACGYEARYNLCLENANGHLFDMHGGRDRGDNTDIAGDWMNVHHNTFQCAEYKAVGVRGIACQGTRVHHNWCYSDDPSYIARASGGVDVVRNVVGPDKVLVETVEATE